MYKIELLRSKSKRKNENFYWRLISRANGNILSTAEPYARRPWTVIKNLAGAFKRGKCIIVDLSQKKKK